MAEETPTLPGMSDVVVPLDARPCSADLSDEKTFTAARLFREQRPIFESACKMLFKSLLSERDVAEYLRISVNTVRAIRKMVLDGVAVNDPSRAAFFYKTKAGAERKAIILQTLETLRYRLTDEQELKKIPVDTLLSMVKTLTEIDSAPERREYEKFSEMDKVIEVDEFTSVINGLSGEKKSAREDTAKDSVSGESSMPDTESLNENNGDFNVGVHLE